MDIDVFFSHYPARKSDSNKYDNGVVMFLSGSYGMAGAALFNLIGARSTGVSYIHSFLPEEIYPIVAANEVSAVYHPYDQDKEDLVEKISFRKTDSCAIGSGIDNLKYADRYLSDLLMKADMPVVIDAKGLKIMAENEKLYHEKCIKILTPHMGEFSILTHMSVKDIEKNKTETAVCFAKKNNVILVLKGKNTLVVSPFGEVYVNDSGNEALARAGSGDILTGMICGLCALYDDPYTAAEDAVWLHGHLCDMAMKHHSKEVFDLMMYPKLADEFFFDRSNITF